MSKRTIFVFGFAVLLVIGGIFLLLAIPEVPEQKGSPADYEVRETEEGRFIKNEKAGLTVKVPDDWIVEKVDVLEGSMIMYSPDAVGVRPSGRVRPPLKRGCIIEVVLVYEGKSLEEIKRNAQESHKSLIVRSDEFETIEVDGKPSIKNIFDSIDLGFSIESYTPSEDKLYGLRISAGPEEIGQCSKVFDEFLETVSIE